MRNPATFVDRLDFLLDVNVNIAPQLNFFDI